MAAASSSPLLSASTSTSKSAPLDLLNEMRAHEVAIAELNSIPANRVIYQKNGNIFFRRSVKSAILVEQKQLDQTKAQLEKLNTAE